jgi:hypothetical protein
MLEVTPVRPALRTLVVAVLMTVIGAAAAQAATFEVVVNSNDDGPGSFRRAIAKANSSPSIRRIVINRSVNVIALQSTVFFTGKQELTIEGNGATLDGTNTGGPALQVGDPVQGGGGGHLTVLSLAVKNAPGEGIAYYVPGDAKGTLRISLLNVEISGNGSHGVLINDQLDPSVPEDENGDPLPPGPNPNGSDATVEVTVLGSRFSGNGNTEGVSVSDNDGLRVNEGGLGDLKLTVRLSVFEENGADGIEVDERGDGDVRVDMLLTQLRANGPFDENDLDDGFDIDEWNNGDVVVSVMSSSANDNHEEGFDFNENDAGNMHVKMVLVAANGNDEEGIDLEEDDDFAGGGDLVSEISFAEASNNGPGDGDAGIKIREKGDGNLDATLDRVQTSNNDFDGIQIREDANGSLVASVSQALSTGNDGHGINFDENRTGNGLSDTEGDLTASVSNSTSTGNTGAGVRADQQIPLGDGSLLLTDVTAVPNTGGATTGSNVTVTVAP